MVPKAASAARAVKTFGDYTLICKLHESEIGTLWAAHPTGNEDPKSAVAIRIVDADPSISSDTLKTLSDVGKAAQALEYGSVAAIRDVVRDSGKLGIISDYVEGEALGALLRVASVRRAAMPTGVGLRIALDLLDGLSFLHSEAATFEDESACAYGGIGPGSVLIGSDGQTRLLELGVSGVAARVDPWNHEPKRVAYASPEALDEDASIDERADVFTVGVFLWEMLQNKRLFGGLSYAAVSKKVREQKIPRVDEARTPGADAVSRALADAVAKALARDPDGRFATVDDFADALQAVEDAPATHEAVAEVVDKLAGRTISSNRTTIVKTASGMLSIPPPAPRKPGEVALPKPPPTPGKKSLPKPPSPKKPPTKPKPPLPPRGKKPPSPAEEAMEELDADVDLMPHVSAPPGPPADEAATQERDLEDEAPQSEEEAEPSTKPTDERDAEPRDDEDEEPPESEEEAEPSTQPTDERDGEPRDDEDGEGEAEADTESAAPEDEEAEAEDEEAEEPASDRPVAAARAAAEAADRAPKEADEAPEGKSKLMVLAAAAVVVVLIIIGVSMSGDESTEGADPATATAGPEGPPVRTAEPTPTETPSDETTTGDTAEDAPDAGAPAQTAQPVATAAPAPQPTAAPQPDGPAPPPTKPPPGSKPDPGRYIPGDL